MLILSIKIKNLTCLTHLKFILRELEQKLSKELEFKILFTKNYNKIKVNRNLSLMTIQVSNPQLSSLKPLSISSKNFSMALKRKWNECTIKNKIKVYKLIRNQGI
jgi:hypothetical protein